MSFYEKRLVPIYNAIESENYDEAIELCLKPDISQIPLVISLLAYAKVSSGDKKMGLQLAHRLQSLQPTDPTVLETLAHTYRRLRLEDEVAMCYENAHKKEPNNQVFAMELFFCYTRLMEMKKMQLISQKLYKATSKPIFLFWSVVSMQLQQDLPAAMITVSEKMIYKIFYETNTKIQPGTEELELYLYILNKQHKVKESLQVLTELLSRPAGPPILENEDFEMNGDRVKTHMLRKLTLRSDLITTLITMEKTKMIQKSIDIVKNEIQETTDNYSNENLQLLIQYMLDLIDANYKILDLYPDQWSAHQCILQTIFSIVKYGNVDSSVFPMVKQQLMKYYEYILQVQAKSPYLRGPYLIEIYIYIYLGETQYQSFVSYIQTDATTTTTLTSSSSSSTTTTTATSSASIRDYFDVTKKVTRYHTLQHELSQHKDDANKKKMPFISLDQIQSHLLANIITLIQIYVHKFQMKQCCFSDIKPILNDIITKDIYQWSTTDSAEAIKYIFVFTTTMCQFITAQLYECKYNYENKDITELTNSVSNTLITSKSESNLNITDLGESADSHEPIVVVEDLTKNDEVDEVIITSTESGTTTQQTTGSKSKKKKKKKKSGATSAQGTTSTSADDTDMTSSSMTPPKSGTCTSTTAKNNEISLLENTIQDKYRNQIVDLLCSLCKNEQLYIFALQLLCLQNQYQNTSIKININSTLKSTLNPSTTTVNAITTSTDTTATTSTSSDVSLTRDTVYPNVMTMLPSTTTADTIIGLPLSTTTTTATAPSNPLSAPASAMAIFFKHPMTVNMLMFLQLPLYYQLFVHYKVACENGIGGEKEVQPVDELILLSSAIHRMSYRICMQQLHINSIATSNDISSSRLTCNPLSRERLGHISSLNKVSVPIRYLPINHDKYTFEYIQFIKALQWCGSCMLGVHGSPYNFAPKLDVLEPLRLLAVGDTSFSIYNKLGVRYIQNDSMSYLILPILLESGMITEAIRQHSGAKRDSADMITKCFKYCNYMKVLELYSFYEKCKNSSQLALSKSELPLLELIESYHDCTDALSYLENYEKGSLNESQPLYTLDTLQTTLHYNYDFDLLVRCDMLTPEEAKMNNIRKQQILSRIHISQLHLFILYYALKCDIPRASSLLKQLKTISINGQNIGNDGKNSTNSIDENTANKGSSSNNKLAVSSSTPVADDTITTSITTSTSTPTNTTTRATAATEKDDSILLEQSSSSFTEQEQLQYVQWSQAIDSGDVSFDKLLFKSMVDIYTLYLHLFTLFTTQKSTTSSSGHISAESKSISLTGVPEGYDESLLIKVLQDFYHIQSHLLDSDHLSSTLTPTTLSSINSSSSSSSSSSAGLMTSSSSSSSSSTSSILPHIHNLPLSPIWIRKTSSFIRTAGTWIPLLLQSLLVNVLQPKTISASSSASRKKHHSPMTTTTTTSSSSNSSSNASSSSSGAVGSSSSSGVNKTDTTTTTSSSSSNTTHSSSGVQHPADMLPGLKDSPYLSFYSDVVKQLSSSFIQLLGDVWMVVNVESNQEIVSTNTVFELIHPALINRDIHYNTTNMTNISSDIQSMASHFKTLLENRHNNNHNESPSSPVTKQQDGVTQSKNSDIIKTTTDTESGSVGEEISEECNNSINHINMIPSTTPIVLDQILASQKISCIRFRDIVGAKLTPLRNLIS